MNVLTAIARIVLGALFAVAGVAAFLVTVPPPMPGLAGAFSEVYYQSHWAMFVGAIQLLIGLAFLANRFVPLALIMLAGFLYNSFAFHITMMPAGLPGPAIVVVLGYIVARPYRSLFAPLFGARSQPTNSEA